MTFSWKSVNIHSNEEDLLRFLMELKMLVFGDLDHGDLIKEHYKIPYITPQGLIIIESKTNQKEIQYQIGSQKVSTQKVYNDILTMAKENLRNFI